VRKREGKKKGGKEGETKEGRKEEKEKEQARGVVQMVEHSPSMHQALFNLQCWKKKERKKRGREEKGN
jgi:hypothetical protein